MGNHKSFVTYQLNRKSVNNRVDLENRWKTQTIPFMKID